MIYSPSRKIAFLHIPKTGGLSISSALKTEWPDWRNSGITSNPLARMHVRAKDVQVRLAGYFIFAVVRNPFDRAVSLWSHVTHQSIPFEEFLTAKRVGFAEILSWPQTDFLMTVNSTMLVHQILRFETIDRDYQQVSKAWGGNGELAHLNRSERSADYQQYYGNKERSIVEERYARDLDVFGYKF